MRKLFAYIFASMTLAACTSEDMFVEEIDVQEQVAEVDTTGVWVMKPELSDVNQLPASRSTLHYDKFGDSKNAMFSWESGDAISVYKCGEQNQYVQALKYVQSEGQTGNSLNRMFEPVGGFKNLIGNTQYVAFTPQGTTETVTPQAGYLIDLKYTGQKQLRSVDMRYYWTTKTSTEEYSKYLDSEKAASAHLGKYDYLCSNPVTTRAYGGATFNMNRLGVVVRFYIKYPVKYSTPPTDAEKTNGMVFTELQLYNSDVEFVQEATLNVTTKDLTPKTTNHVMKLQLGDFDLSLKGDGKPENPQYFDEYPKDKFTPYLIAYMMLAPIDLNPETAGKAIEKSTLYLVAHEKTDDTKLHYYKAELSTQPTLTANMFYQWSPGPNPDLPIEFTETTVEEWSAGPGFYNDGKGTETW